MRRAIVVLLLTAALGTYVATAKASTLPSPLPDAKCSTLTNGTLHGKALWKHWIWHLRRFEYNRICNTIYGESRWDRYAHNGTYKGLVQFGSSWYAGRWHFDPYNPVLSIRVMVYVLRHPDTLGGWSNWAGH